MNVLHLLRRHPLTVKAHFAYSLVLTYALPAHELAPMLPPGLAVDAWEGWGFAALAMVKTHALRPAMLPRTLGQNFFLAGYRLFTTFQRPDGHTLRGLYILRSDTDRRLMAAAGNLLTHYQYRVSHVETDNRDGRARIRVRTANHAADLDVTADIAREGPLPPTTVFHTPAQARRFAGPLPYTFDHEQETGSIIAIKATRAHWQPQIVEAQVQQATFFQRGAFAGTHPRLASAFYVSDIDYQWNRGVRYGLN